MLWIGTRSLKGQKVHLFGKSEGGYGDVRD